MDVIALRTAFGLLGFTVAAQEALTNVDEQNIRSLDDLKSLQDKDNENVCNAIRKPGGILANPIAAQKSTGGNI